MTASTPGARGWGISLALHGLLLAGGFILIRPNAAPVPPLRWEVALVESAPAILPPPEAKSVAPSKLEAKPTPRPEAEVKPEAQRTRIEAPRPVPIPPPPAQTSEPASRTEPVAEPVRQAAPSTPASGAEPVPRQVPAPIAAVIAPASPVASSEKQAPAPSPAHVEPDPDTQRRWQALLAAKLRELKRYPSLSRRLGQEGVVVLEARILADGRAAANIKQSSGYAALDRAAVKLFEDAAAALTGEWSPHGGSRLEIPIAYRLES